jgi:hypothetical protein
MSFCRKWIASLLTTIGLVVSTLSANDIPTARPVTDGKTKAEIVKLVKQMQVLFHEAQTQADSVLAQLTILTTAHNAALAQTQAVQVTLDTRTWERDKARLDAAKQAKAKWMWFSAFSLTAIGFAAFAYFKR